MYYPLMLKVKGEPCLVVGGGAVALKKARALRQAGADVTVVSPDFTPGFLRLRVRRVRRGFRTGDVVRRVLPPTTPGSIGPSPSPAGNGRSP